MHIHETTYTHGDIVYLMTDREQLPRMVLAFTLRPGGVAYYELGCGADASFHFDIEMSSKQNRSLLLGIDVESTGRG